MATKQSYNKRLQSLENERSELITLWHDLSTYHLGSHGKFLTTGKRDVKDIKRQYNNKSRIAVRTMAAGMMSGITSPARPWFQLGTSNPDLNDQSAVKLWLGEVQSKMYRVFSSSNIYNTLHKIYMEAGTFGTSAMGVYFDYDKVITTKSYTIGSYMIAQNDKAQVNTFYREYQKTVADLVKEFGIENVSNTVKQQWESGNTESWIDVVYVIEPNDNRDMQSPLAKDKKFRSVYYEKSNTDDKFLRRSGFDDFPVMAPRWSITGEDIYGSDCPGMIALDDTKTLQLGETRKYQVIDKIVSPPLQAPASMRSHLSNGKLKPDQISFYDNPNQKIESVYNLNPDLNALMAINQETERRIDSAFFVDLFTMMMNSDRRQITAREVAEKQEEKLLLLGPVLESLHTELLDPIISRTFSIMQEAGILPPPPPELDGVELNVEYVSILAQAQRMIGVSGIERVVGFASEISQYDPKALKKINTLVAIDEYAEAMGVNPKIITTNDEVEQQVAAEQKAAAAQQQMMQSAQAVETAKNASQINTQEGNAVGDLLANAGLQ